MATPNYKGLLESYQKLPEAEANRYLRESFAAKDLRPTDFDLGRLFCECFGWNAFQACRFDRSNLATQAMEAAGSVSTAAFSNISGQIVFSQTVESYQDEEFKFTRIIPERQSPYTFEKIAGITRIGNEVLKVAESQPYPYAGVGQTWIHGPETEKRGLIVPVTREAIFFERTGQLLDRCREVGYWLGFDREQRAIDCVIDENAGAVSAAVGGHRYHWRDTSIETYGNNSGNHSWDNLEASNALVDWTDVDAAEQLLNGMTDPDTGAPILAVADTLIVTKQLEKTALRIRNATEIRVATPGYATTGNPTETIVANPYGGAFEVVSTRLLAARLGTDTSWFFGTPSKAFWYHVNFPFQTLQAPSNSMDEFNRDIVMQFRADERGNYGTKEPRLMVKCTA